MKEPSILDYLKSFVKADKRIHLKKYLGIEKEGDHAVDEIKKRLDLKHAFKINWLVFCGCFIALIAQLFLEPADRKTYLAICLYIIAAIFLWIGYKKNDLNEKILSEKKTNKVFSVDIKIIYFGVSLILLVAAFLLFSENTFTWLNLILWLGSIIFFLLSVWEIKQRRKKLESPDYFFILIFILVFTIAGIYRIYQINQVPGEMFSDHAEKLLDVMDVLEGKTPIFFTRNTGREPIQFYLTTVIIKLFHTGIRFLSLKIGTVFAGLITLPFIYLLGKQLANKWVGLLAMFFAGIAYWPNVISRVALRFTFYPLFAAPVLYFLFKGLQTRNRNDLILCGIFLGLGLNGYSPARILPIFIVLAFLIYILHNKSKKDNLNSLWVLALLTLVSFYVFLPLFRYFLDEPGNFSYRALSRLTSIEKPIEGSIFLTFLNNLWKSSIMFFYDNGQIWVHSIPNRPALDYVSAAFCFAGIIFLVKRYLINHRWEDLALLFSLPILALPSTLSLAFPRENPSLNRSSGAIVTVFIIAAIGFYQCFKGVFNKKQNLLSRVIVTGFMLMALFLTLFQNYNLVFIDYSKQFLANAWNSSEISQVIMDFVARGNSPDHAYVIPYPYWVDTRLVGINAGFPEKDYALAPEEISLTEASMGEKLYILKPEDNDNLEVLEALYPDGKVELFHSQTISKDFIMFTTSEN